MNASIVISAIVSFLLQIGLTVFGWLRIPTDARVAIHWGLGGKPNGYASKPFALLAVPVLTILVGAFTAARSEGASPIPSLFAFAVLLGAHALIVFTAIR